MCSQACGAITLLCLSIIILGGASTGIAFGFIRNQEIKNSYHESICNMTGCRSGNQTCSRTETWFCGEYCFQSETIYFPCTFVEYVIASGNITRSYYYTFTPPNVTFNCTAVLQPQYTCYVSETRQDLITNISSFTTDWIILFACMIFTAIVGVCILIGAIVWNVVVWRKHH